MFNKNKHSLWAINDPTSSLPNSLEPSSFTGECLATYQSFVINLPHGGALWRYVLTGEGEHALRQQSAFVDLDHVLIPLHAYRYSPNLLDNLRYDTTSEDLISHADIHQGLNEVLDDVSTTLLVNEQLNTEQRAQGQQTYLRLLDIFFHLLDQRTLDDSIYEQLVTNDDSSFMTNTEFYQRFSLENYGQSEPLPERLREKIHEFIDTFDMWFHKVDLDYIDKMELVFGESRLTYDLSDWPDEPYVTVCLASYLVHRDFKNNVNDSYTRQLNDAIQRKFMPCLTQVISRTMDTNTQVCPELMSWFADDDISAELSTERVDRIISALVITYTHIKHGSPLGSDQRAYRLFESLSEFRYLILASYYLEMSQPSPFTKKILRFSFALAEQRTLQILLSVQVQDNYKRCFKDNEELFDFEQTMISLGAPKGAITAFSLQYHRRHNPTLYLQRIEGYLKSGDQLKQWPSRLGKVDEKFRLQFFLDVYRADPSRGYQLAGERQRILQETLHRRVISGTYSLEAMFDENEIFYYGSFMCSSLPDDFFTVDAQVRADSMLTIHQTENPLAVYRQVGDHFNLVITSEKEPLSKLDNGWLAIDPIFIFKEHVDVTSIIEAVKHLGTIKEHKKNIVRAAQQFLANEIRFGDYYKIAKCCVCFDSFYWSDSSSHRQKRPNLLPFVISEPDINVRNRLIRLICFSDGFATESQFDMVAFELFLEQLLAQQKITLRERFELPTSIFERELELEELFIPFRDALAQEINNIQ